MRIDIFAGDVWPAITKACRTKGPRRAAIAYVGAHAPDLLPLKRGDALVCDASDRVLLGRGTSPDALQAYLERGVRVLSYRGLHAKVLVTSELAVIGSANASQHSTLIEEAVVVTDEPTAMRQARAFIDGLVAATEVDEDFIAAARVMWERGKPGPMSSVRRPGAGDALLPGSFRMYLSHPEMYEPSKSEMAMFKRESRRVRRQVGASSIYTLDSYRLPEGDVGFRRDDVIIQVDDGSTPHVWPPAVVVSEPVSVRGSRHRVQLTKGLARLEPIPLGDASAALAASGIKGGLGRERWVRSKATQDGLLALWGLSTDR